MLFYGTSLCEVNRQVTDLVFSAAVTCDKNHTKLSFVLISVGHGTLVYHLALYVPQNLEKQNGFMTLAQMLISMMQLSKCAFSSL